MGFKASMMRGIRRCRQKNWGYQPLCLDRLSHEQKMHPSLERRPFVRACYKLIFERQRIAKDLKLELYRP
jgi:hypothetical protein